MILVGPLDPKLEGVLTRIFQVPIVLIGMVLKGAPAVILQQTTDNATNEHRM